MTLSQLIFRILIRSFYFSRKQLDRAALDKDRALTSKALAETRASQLESLRKNSVAVASGYGILVVFCYCFFDIKFFPSGMSTGDVLFFLFCALGLGLISLLCIALGMSAFLPASYFEDSLLKPGSTAASSIPDDDKKFGECLWFYSPLLVIVLSGCAALLPHVISPDGPYPSMSDGIVALLAWLALACAFWTITKKVKDLHAAHGSGARTSDAFSYGAGYLIVAPILCYTLFKLGEPGWPLLVGIFVAGMTGAMGIRMLDTQTLAVPSDPVAFKAYARQRLITQIFFVIALAPALILTPLRKTVFLELGVRSENTAITLDKANLALLQSAANTADIPLSICRGENDYATVAPVDVLWHASGTRSIVHLGKASGIDVELNSSGLKLVRGKVERCIEIKENLLFASGKSELLNDTEEIEKNLTKELQPLLKELEEQKWKIKSVKVIGHADPMPMEGNGNEALAKGRAEIVKGLLQKSAALGTLFSNVPLEPVSDSARHPIKTCDTKESSAYQRTCNEANRRVEIRFRLEQQVTPASANANDAPSSKSAAAAQPAAAPAKR